MEVVQYLLTKDCELAKDHEGRTAFDLIQSQEVLELLCQKFEARTVSSISVAKAVLKKDNKRIAIYRKINAIIDVSELMDNYGIDETKINNINSQYQKFNEEVSFEKVENLKSSTPELLKASIINYFVEVGDLDTIKMISPSLQILDFNDDGPLEILSKTKTENK